MQHGASFDHYLFDREESPVADLADLLFGSFPYYMVGAAISGLLWAIKVAYLIYRSYRDYLERLEAEKNQAEVERNHAEEMAGLHLRTIEALALAIEAKDQTTHDHLQRVQIYCTEVGKELGMSEVELKPLLAASLLRDIGKLAVPEHIISKPGRLTPEEFEKMKIHPVVGAEILESVRFPYPVAPIVRHHHEKWDGSGYPDGIGELEIPLGARILSAVDCFDALSSDRQYRRALPIDESIAYLVKEAGRAYDPKVVEVMARRYQELEQKAREHSDNERAKLSVDIRVARGDAPDAGFASDGTKGAGDRSEFVESIASARAEAQFLFSLSQELTKSLDSTAMFSGLSEKLRTAIPFETMAYYHVDGETLNPLFVSGKDEELLRSLRIPVGHGLSGWVVHEKKTILNGNPAVEPGFLKDRTVITNLRSALSVPVEGESGVIGALTLYSMSRDQYSNDHLRVLMAVSTRVAFHVESLLRFQKASGDAYTDQLTGLFNSRWLATRFSETCERVAAEKSTLAVLVFDLEGFKMLNDTHGHLRGNEALRAIASRSLESLPEHCHMARMGGDEFVVLLPGYSAGRAIEVAERIQSIVEQAGSRQLDSKWLSASWGLSEFGVDGETPEALLSEADRRMYLNKRSKHDRTASGLSSLSAGVEGESAEKPAYVQRRVTLRSVAGIYQNSLAAGAGIPCSSARRCMN